jgi:hypothetical protein
VSFRPLFFASDFLALLWGGGPVSWLPEASLLMSVDNVSDVAPEAVVGREEWGFACTLEGVAVEGTVSEMKWVFDTLETCALGPVGISAGGTDSNAFEAEMLEVVEGTVPAMKWVFDALETCALGLGISAGGTDPNAFEAEMLEVVEGTVPAMKWVFDALETCALGLGISAGGTDPNAFEAESWASGVGPGMVLIICKLGILWAAPGWDMWVCGKLGMVDAVDDDVVEGVSSWKALLVETVPIEVDDVDGTVEGISSWKVLLDVIFWNTEAVYKAVDGAWYPWTVVDKETEFGLSAGIALVTLLTGATAPLAETLLFTIVLRWCPLAYATYMY